MQHGAARTVVTTGLSLVGNCRCVARGHPNLLLRMRSTRIKSSSSCKSSTLTMSSQRVLSENLELRSCAATLSAVVAAAVQTESWNAGNPSRRWPAVRGKQGVDPAAAKGYACGGMITDGDDDGDIDATSTAVQSLVEPTLTINYVDMTIARKSSYLDGDYGVQDRQGCAWAIQRCTEIRVKHKEIRK